MGTKSITVTDEAYERLKAHKRDGESFTDTLLRITADEADVMSGFGSMRDVDDFRDVVESTRDEFDRDLRTRQDDISRQ